MGRPLLLACLLPLACGRSPECTRLLDHIGSVRIGIALYAVGDGPESPVKGLRSLDLHHGGFLREPHAMWPDGSPVSADTRLSKEAMLAVVEDLEDLGVWEGAELFWSEARKEPKGPPPVEERFRGGMTVRPSCGVTAVYTSDDYHVYVVRWVPWGEETTRTLDRLARYAPLAKELSASFERLRQQG